MKKVTSLLLLAGVAAFGLVGCGDDVVTQPDDPQVQSVTVSPSSISIEVGEQATLAANVQADDGADTSVSWSSSNSSVASVDGSGNVTGQSTGSATIVATSNADASKSGAAEVTVTQAGGDRPTVSILGIDCDESIADCNEPSNISGDITVTVNVDEGDQDIAAVQLLLNGEVVREQTFSTNVSGIAAATEGTSNITWELATDGAGQCTMGEQLTPNFANGLYELQARLMLEAGDPETATWDDSLNFNNSNRIDVVHIDGSGATVVGGGAARNSTAPEGQRFWGHNYMGDGAVTDTLHFAACPVVFDDDLTVDEIRMAGQKSSEPDAKDFEVDFGSGHGAKHADDEEPYQYLARPAPNDSVEDTQSGHVIGSGGCVGCTANPTWMQVFDDEGEDVTDQFRVFPVTNFWLDFTAPMEVEPGSGQIQIDEMAISTEHYTDEVDDYVLPDGTVFADGDPDGDGIASDYNLVGIIDGGVGVDLDAQQTDVYHDTAADIGGASVPVAEDVEGLNDTDGMGAFLLAEQGPATDPDWYVANVPELVDLLKNSMTTAGIPALNASTPHGVDRTEPTITPVDTIPDDKVIDDTEIVFDAADPVLDNDAGDDPGSDVNDDGCGAGTPGTQCTAIFAALGDTVDLGVSHGASATDSTFAIDLTAGIGIGLPEGQTDITLSVPDRGIKAPNPATLSYSFIFDTTPPTVGFSGVTGLNQSDADFVEFTVDGKVTDRNGDGTAVTSAILDVTFADGDGICGTGDDTAATGVTPMVDTVTAQVQANGGEYTVVFNADNNGVPNDTLRYCFNMTADDGAMTADGADAGHEQTRSAGKDFIWNP